MPTLTSRGAASARGFGLLGAAPLNLQTATFTSSGSWTAPVGTTNLTVLTGAGGSGTPFSEGWYTGNLLAAYSYSTSDTGGSIENTPTYEQVTSYAESVLGDLNSSTADRTKYWTVYRYFYNPSTYKTIVESDFTSRRMRGVVTKYEGPWDNKSGQYVQGIGGGWYMRAELYSSEAATTGADSTAFGNTYAGGVGGAATPVTTNNVAVTPGQTYSISVGSGGYVTFQYLA